MQCDSFSFIRNTAARCIIIKSTIYCILAKCVYNDSKWLNEEHAKFNISKSGFISSVSLDKQVAILEDKCYQILLLDEK